MRELRRILPIAGAVLGAALLAAIAAACGGSGGGGLSLEEYFARLQQITEDSGQRSRQIRSAYDEALKTAATDGDRIALTQSYFTSTLSVFTGTLARANEDEPPDAVREAHQETFGSVEKYTLLLRSFNDQLAQAQNISEMEQLVSQFRAAATGMFEEIDAGCAQLQGIADEQQIAVDLNCSQQDTSPTPQSPAPSPAATP